MVTASAEDCGCYGDFLCFKHKLAYWRESGGLNIDPRATPSRRNNNPPRRPLQNNWERGIPTDNRGMPFLGPDLQPIGQKKFTESRRKIDQGIRQMRNTSPSDTTR